MNTFKRAERKSAKLRAALCGTSGSGKTYSALLLAKGLGKNVALIDTERGSAELYSDLFGYDVAQLSPPFEPRRYIELIKSAAAAYDVLVIDSLSHAWVGEGGVLEMHENAAKADRTGNSYTAWRNVTPQHNALVDAILNAPCHVIVTMRSKTAYELIDDGRGKKKPLKIGLAPIQRDGLEYEFTLVLDVSVDGHVATASKDRTRLWDGRNAVITEQHGHELRAWIDSGAKAAPIQPAQSTPYDHAGAIGVMRLYENADTIREWVQGQRKAYGWREATHPDYIRLIENAKKRIAELDAGQAAEPKSDQQPRKPLNDAPGKAATANSLAASGFDGKDPAPFDDSLEPINA